MTQSLNIIPFGASSLSRPTSQFSVISNASNVAMRTSEVQPQPPTDEGMVLKLRTGIGFLKYANNINVSIT